MVGATIQRGRHRHHPRGSFKSGRLPKVEFEKIAKVVSDADGIITPKKLKRTVQKKFRVNYHTTNIRQDIAQA